MATLEDLKKAQLKRLLSKEKVAAPTAPRPTAPGLTPEATAEVRRTGQEEMLQGLKESVRPTMIAGGAMAGSAVGVAGGTVLGGPPGAAVGLLGGGAAGAEAGSLAFDSLNDALQFFGVEELPGGTPPGETQLETMQARVLRGAEEARTEAMFTGGFSALFPVKRFLTPLLGKMFGVRTGAAKQMARLAQEQGVMLSAVDVGGPVSKGFARTLGIFPFTGTPLRRARNLKEAQVTNRVAEILNEVAPNSTLAGEIGVDLAKAADASHKQFRSVSAQLYDRFREAARGFDGPIVPTAETKTIIKDFAEEIRRGEIPLTGKDVQVLKGGTNDQFEQFLQDAERLPDSLTYDQWARLKNQLEAFVSAERPDPFMVKRVAQIKQSMEADLNNIGVNLAPEQAENLLRMKQEADGFYSTGILAFQTPTAAKFARTNKRIFTAGPDKPGSINPDELLKPVFNADSPQALKDLRGLVGDKAFKRAARTHLDDITARSLSKEVRGGEEVEVFDLEKFAKNLGLVDGLKNRTAALEEMLRGTGVRVSDLNDFVKNARIMEQRDPSLFVTRRVTLGGAAALAAAGGVVGGALGAGIGPFGALMTGLGARGISSVLANPKALKALTRAFSPDVSEAFRRAAVVRLIRIFGEQASPDQQGIEATTP